MSNEQRKDQRFTQQEAKTRPVEISDDDLEPVVGGVKPPAGAGADPVCVSSL